MTYNMHLLQHVAKSVNNLGPLYLHDAFDFENENRLLLQLKLKNVLYFINRFLYFPHVLM